MTFDLDKFNYRPSALGGDTQIDVKVVLNFKTEISPRALEWIRRRMTQNCGMKNLTMTGRHPRFEVRGQVRGFDIPKLKIFIVKLGMGSDNIKTAYWVFGK